MSAGWVAGSVRARALARRRIGSDAARQMAACGSLQEAVAMLAATPYGNAMRTGQAAGPPYGGAVPAAPLLAAGLSAEGAGQTQVLAAAQRAVAEAVLWDLRVLAGWLPQGGLQMMRALAGWFEIANVEDRLLELAGRRAGDVFRLGALATAWPQLRRSASGADLRARLAASAWKDPGGEAELALRIGMRARWAERVAALGEPARTWACAAVVLLLAGERFVAGRQPPPALESTAIRLIGPGATGAVSIDELAGRLPARLAWVLEPVASAADLWLGEAAWWKHVERDGLALLSGPGFDSLPVLGAAAVLAADARRVGAALEIAARGGGSLEVFDVVA